MADLPFAGFAVATDANFSSGPRTGSPTKLPFADVPQGMVPGDPVTPEEINYALNLTGLALTYLRGGLDRVNFWTVAQSMAQGVVLGGGLLDTFANAIVARVAISVPPVSVSEWAVAWQASAIPTGLFIPGGKARVCTRVVGTNASLDYAITLNAKPTSSGGWTKDKTGQPSLIARWSATRTEGPGRFVVAGKPAGDNAEWTDTYGSSPPTGWSTGVLTMLGEGESSRWFGNLLATGQGSFGALLSAASLLIIGDSYLTGDAIVHGNLRVDGSVSFASIAPTSDLVVPQDLHVGRDAFVARNAEVTGTTHLIDDVTADAGISAAGAISAGGNITATGVVSGGSVASSGGIASAAGIVAGTTLGVGGNASVGGDISAGTGLYTTERSAAIAGLDNTAAGTASATRAMSFVSITSPIELTDIGGKAYRGKAGHVKQFWIAQTAAAAAANSYQYELICLNAATNAIDTGVGTGGSVALIQIDNPDKVDVTTKIAISVAYPAGRYFQIRCVPLAGGSQTPFGAVGGFMVQE